MSIFCIGESTSWRTVSFETDEAKKVLHEFIETDVDDISITCTRGDDLTMQYWHLLIRDIKYAAERKVVGTWRETKTKEDNLRFLFAKELSGDFVRMIPCEGFHLKFTFVKTNADGLGKKHLYIEVDQDLEPEDPLKPNSQDRFKVGDDSCIVRIYT